MKENIKPDAQLEEQEMLKAVESIINYQSSIVPIDLNKAIMVFEELGKESNPDLATVVINILSSLPILDKMELDLLYKTHWLISDEEYEDEPIFICGHCGKEFKVSPLFCPSCGYMNIGIATKEKENIEEEEKEKEENGKEM